MEALFDRSPEAPPEIQAPGAPRAASRDFRDFDELSESFVEFDSEYMQVGTGPVRAQVSRLMLDRVVLSRGDEEAPQYVNNSTNGGVASLLLLAAPSPATYWLGRRADERTLLSYAPGAEHVGRSSGAMTWMTIHYRPATLERQQLALGLPVSPIVTGSLDPRPEQVTALRRAAARAFEVASDPNALESAPVRRALEESILNAAAHATTRAPVRADAAPSSRERAVRRALDVLAARAREPLYLADLCEAASVSERTLRNAFYEFYGLSPIRFLHVRRMGLVRRALREADPARDHVSPIAARHGFTNLGRFAVEFRRLFGVSPSQVLRAPGGAGDDQGFTPS
jgi:AraC family ethanolamine operon transcriptional activator